MSIFLHNIHVPIPLNEGNYVSQKYTNKKKRIFYCYIRLGPKRSEVIHILLLITVSNGEKH